MWREFYLKRIAEGGLMHPCRSLRHFAQMHNSKHKQGLDGICDIEEKFASRALRVDYDQKVTLCLFLDFVVGVAGLWQIYTVMKKSTKKTSTILGGEGSLCSVDG